MRASSCPDPRKGHAVSRGQSCARHQRLKVGGSRSTSADASSVTNDTRSNALQQRDSRCPCKPPEWKALASSQHPLAIISMLRRRRPHFPGMYRDSRVRPGSHSWYAEPERAAGLGHPGLRGRGSSGESDSFRSESDAGRVAQHSSLSAPAACWRFTGFFSSVGRWGGP